MTFNIAKWSFLLLVVSLPLVRPFHVFVYGLQIPFTDFIFLCCSLFFAIAAFQKQVSIRTDRLFTFVGVYAVAFAISAVLSVEPKTSAFKLMGEFYLFGLSFLAFNLARDEQFQKRIVFAWLVGSGLTALTSIAGFTLFYLGLKDAGSNYFLSHLGSLPAGDYPRIHALFANANMLCNYLNVSVILALLAAKLSWLRKSWAIVSLFGIFFAALLSISAGLGGIALSLGIWFWAVAPKKWYSTPALAIGIVLAIAVFASTLISPDTENTSQEIAIPITERVFEPSVRILIWEDTISTVRQYPWFGKGTGTDVANVNYEVLSGMRQTLRDAHNSWLSVLGQTGVIGLTAFCLLLFQIVACQ